MSSTTVHLVRHGEVHNPEGILYGRLPGYRLSERGEAMAQRLAEHFTSPADDGAPRPIALVVASPLERAQQTATPVAEALGLELGADERLIEAGNYFQGMTFGVGDGSLRHVRHWPRLWNPWRPSWGEAYREQVARMMGAVHDARAKAEGREAVLVSHQLPIWVTRLAAEKRPFIHDPRKRECSLASVTSLHFEGDRLARVSYAEPAKDLLPGAKQVPGA
ncbi:MAG: histidine phosphatase family protein [Actinomycetales bacterium]|nr:histidine phosphatase family protein [Actinomycetales bacterium]